MRVTAGTLNAGGVKETYTECEAGGRGRSQVVWSLLFAGGQFADLAGCG